MTTKRPGGVLMVLAAVVSVIYVAAWCLVALVAVAVPAVEILPDREAFRAIRFGLPVTVAPADVRLESTWNRNSTTIAVSDTEATIRVPISLAPPWFRATTYASVAIAALLFLPFMFHLRAFVRSARDGTPFDPRNAHRLRWMGPLLLLGEATNLVFTKWLAAAVLATIAAPPMPLAGSVDLNEGIVLVGLVLLALSEIFKHGAALEDEQSLVV